MIEGQYVEKVGGDYTFKGYIVSCFNKHDPTKMLGVFNDLGPERFVVQDDRGVLHIYSGKNLQYAIEPST